MMEKLVVTTADPGIPTLAAVLDPAELVTHLRVLAPGQWDASQQIRLRVLKWHKASRCTFEIELPTSKGARELIGKVYAEDRSDVYRVMEEIRQAGFGGDEEFSIARPLAYVASLRLLLYEKVAGTRARSLIADPNASDRIAAVQRCATWLARFQDRAPRTGPVFQIEDVLEAWKRWLQPLADVDAFFAGKARRLLARLKAMVPASNDVEMRAGHGMYTCGQVLLRDGRAVVIDWDTFNFADPSHDVARFLVDLKRTALKYFGSMQALDWAEEAFIATYADAGGSSVPTLAFQQAAICLERAKSDLDKRVRGWAERADMMLDEGIRILEPAQAA